MTPACVGAATQGRNQATYDGENGKEKTMSVCARTAERERRRREIRLPVIVCGNELGDDETAGFSSVPRWQEPTLAQKHVRRNLSPNTFLLSRFYTKAARNHGGFSALLLLSIGNSRVHAWWHQTVSLLEQMKCSFKFCPGDCQPIGSTWQNVPHKIRFLLPHWCVFGSALQLKLRLELWIMGSYLSVSAFILYYSICGGNKRHKLQTVSEKYMGV